MNLSPISVVENAKKREDPICTCRETIHCHYHALRRLHQMVHEGETSKQVNENDLVLSLSSGNLTKSKLEHGNSSMKTLAVGTMNNSFAMEGNAIIFYEFTSGFK